MDSITGSFSVNNGWYGHDVKPVNQNKSFIIKVFKNDEVFYFWYNSVDLNLENFVYFFSVFGSALNLSEKNNLVYIGDGEEDCYFLIGKKLMLLRCKDFFDSQLNIDDFVISKNYNFTENKLWEDLIFLFLSPEFNDKYISPEICREFIKTVS